MDIAWNRFYPPKDFSVSRAGQGSGNSGWWEALMNLLHLSLDAFNPCVDPAVALSWQKSASGKCNYSQTPCFGQSTTHKLPFFDSIIPVAGPAKQTQCKLKLASLNFSIKKHRKFKFFQTLNHPKIMWDPRSHPRGLLGGHKHS